MEPNDKTKVQPKNKLRRGVLSGLSFVLVAFAGLNIASPQEKEKTSSETDA
jgi:hypothetical protein